jgi:hypothetical protein
LPLSLNQGNLIDVSEPVRTADSTDTIDISNIVKKKPAGRTAATVGSASEGVDHVIIPATGSIRADAIEDAHSK